MKILWVSSQNPPETTKTQRIFIELAPISDTFGQFQWKVLENDALDQLIPDPASFCVFSDCSRNGFIKSVIFTTVLTISLLFGTRSQAENLQMDFSTKI